MLHLMLDIALRIIYQMKKLNIQLMELTEHNFISKDDQTIISGFETGTHEWLARQSGVPAIAPRPLLLVQSIIRDERI